MSRVHKCSILPILSLLATHHCQLPVHSNVLFFKILSKLTHTGQTVRETRLLRSLYQSSKQHIGQVFFIKHFHVHEQTSYTRHVLLVLENTCHHILDVSQSEWHLGSSLCPQKMNNRTLFLMGCFQW